ncbi:MAG: cytochrome-c oxidase, cbb3-type subunit III [Parvularcula sp.]|jgi:cytochrome c oxidase cbb3-type subunit 3|nr:cytochrome-c oxidase, cbb3-type subunit III [Parvularcula sp.]
MTDTNTNKERDVDQPTGVETTGHEWDGIKELNNPLPRWWLIVFYATIAWAVVYCIFMPSFPGVPGLRNHSERLEVEKEIALATAERQNIGMQLLSTRSMREIERDPELLQFALAAGRSAFGDNCATCHGAGGRGAVGYPNLADDVWLWGGTLTDIKQTLIHGIRSTSDNTRLSLMPAFGTQDILDGEEIAAVTTYVLNLSEPQNDPDAVEAGAAIFEVQCAACHGANGKGDRMQGAPNLTDAEWLYGSTRRAIQTQIYAPRHGVMPYWSERLDEATITALAIYVHSLGGGEEEAPDTAESEADTVIGQLAPNSGPAESVNER